MCRNASYDGLYWSGKSTGRASGTLEFTMEGGSRERHTECACYFARERHTECACYYYV
jgi:hypothetical protein